jgi:opacity protein-like surface antigen
MKTQLIAAACAAALLATAGAANAQAVGQVGASYSRLEADFGSLGDGDVNAYGVDGAVRFDAGSLGAQVDGAITRFDDDGGDATVWSATGHLNAKLSQGLVGGFAGFTTSDDVTLWAVGVEGQANLAPSTSLYGQLGYGQSDDLDDVDFWAGRAEIRQFVTDNFKLQASAGFTKADGNGADLDMWNLGVDGEYQFADTPWSIAAGYEHGDIDDLDVSSDTFRVGVRYTFGGTLKDRDQSGASLGSAANLFGGTLGQGVVAVLGAALP